MTNFNLENQTFGVEIEFGGIYRSTAIRILAETINGRVIGHNEVKDSQNRTWKIVRDASVNAMGAESNELVTPPLYYNDMETLQEVVRNLRRAGARVDSSCGMHVHVGLQNYNLNKIKNLVKFYAKYEDLFYKAAKVLPNRAGHYAKKLNDKHPNLIEKINKAKDMDDLRKLWYGNDQQYFTHYDNSRYAGLNLHNIWYKGWFSGTIEFRLFNSTLHAGEVRSYVTLVLAISALALNKNTVTTRTNNTMTDSQFFPKLLQGLGITSRNQVTKNVFKHLTKEFQEAIS
jgi:hypothetical protein